MASGPSMMVPSSPSPSMMVPSSPSPSMMVRSSPAPTPSMMVRSSPAPTPSMMVRSSPAPTPSPFSSKCKPENRGTGNYPLSASFTVQKCEKYPIPGKNPFTKSGIKRKYGILLSGTAPYFKNLASEPNTDYEYYNKVFIKIIKENDTTDYSDWQQTTVTPESTWSLSTGALSDGDGTYTVHVQPYFCGDDYFEKTINVRHEPFSVAVIMSTIPWFLILLNIWYLWASNPFISRNIPYELIYLLNISYVVGFIVCCIMFRVLYYWRLFLFIIILVQIMGLHVTREENQRKFRGPLQFIKQYKEKIKMSKMTKQQRQKYVTEKEIEIERRYLKLRQPLKEQLRKISGIMITQNPSGKAYAYYRTTLDEIKQKLSKLQRQEQAQKRYFYPKLQQQQEQAQKRTSAL